MVSPRPVVGHLRGYRLDVYSVLRGILHPRWYGNGRSLLTSLELIMALRPPRTMTAAQQKEIDDLRQRIKTLKAAKLNASAKELRRKLAALRGGYELIED